jgi:hypothetical protein
MHRKVSRKFWSELHAAQGMSTNWRDVVQRRVCSLVLCHVVVESRCPPTSSGCQLCGSYCCCSGRVGLLLAVACCILFRKDGLQSMSDSFFCICPVLSTLIDMCVCVCVCVSPHVWCLTYADINFAFAVCKILSKVGQFCQQCRVCLLL